MASGFKALFSGVDSFKRTEWTEEQDKMMQKYIVKIKVLDTLAEICLSFIEYQIGP